LSNAIRQKGRSKNGGRRRDNFRIFSKKGRTDTHKRNRSARPSRQTIDLGVVAGQINRHGPRGPGAQKQSDSASNARLPTNDQVRKRQPMAAKRPPKSRLQKGGVGLPLRLLHPHRVLLANTAKAKIPTANKLIADGSGTEEGEKEADMSAGARASLSFGKGISADADT